MSPEDIAAAVRCGRQLRQSRQRVVEAVLVTCEQREAGTPGQACTVPLCERQPTAEPKRTGSKRVVIADVGRECCIETRKTDANARLAMRGVRLMFEIRPGRRDRSAAGNVRCPGNGS
jgi:hypothetical protein